MLTDNFRDDFIADQNDSLWDEGLLGVQALKAGLRMGSESLKNRLRQFRGIDGPARSTTCLVNNNFNEFQGHPGGAQ